MEASSTRVIKVQYGKTLRRFNAQIVDGKLELSMDELRAKIHTLFSIAPNAELNLTYIDEDDDVVTLAADDDLQDVVNQYLNPLRITAKRKPEKNAAQLNRDGGSSIPLRSPRVQEPLQNLNAGVSEVLKTIPEPLRDAMLKLSTDLASKASSSAPLITELVDHFSKVGLSYLGQLSESPVGRKSRKNSGASEKKEDESLKSNESLAKPQPEASTENKVKLVKATGGSMETSFSKTSDVLPSPGDSRNISIGKKEKVEKINECVEKLSGKASAVNIDPYKNVVYKLGEPHVGMKTSDAGCGGSSDNFWATLLHDKSIVPGSYCGPIPSNDCPFSGLPGGNTSAALPLPHADLLKRSSNQNDGSRVIFHRGVRCDGCGVHPITGPRFKSKVKVDYDLCSICFSEMGNESDYIRMDRPAASIVSRQLRPLKGLYDSNQGPLTPPQRFYSGPKLDSRFIQDVNIIDGTTMAPLTPFTKIWRMRNTGMVVWPPRTQLVWIGGDRLSNQYSVEVEVPAGGLPIGQEFAVSVDFIAPELPGRYISYWRLTSPSGQKFGQRVWVLIQVDASVTPPECIRGLNLNLPPATGPETNNVNVEPIVENNHSEPDNSGKTVELVKPVNNFQPNKEHEMKFPINDSLLVGTGASIYIPPFVPPFPQFHHPARGASSSVPPADVYSPQPVKNVLERSTPPAPITAPQHFPIELPSNKEVEEKLLRELEEMGFRQVDLNKEILRMNEYDLEQAVDDLCGVAEWDPILEELQDMK